MNLSIQNLESMNLENKLKHEALINSIHNFISWQTSRKPLEKSLKPMKALIQTTKQGIYLVKGSTRLKAETSTPYLKGFNDALKRGIEKNTYATDAYRHLYRIGYDAGITEYCRQNHPEEFEN